MAPDTVPFPPLPPRLRATHGAVGLRLRRFGASGRDLDVDLQPPATAEPRRVTAVLERCTLRPDGGALDPQFFWDLSVGKRVECLLTLAGLESDAEFDVVLRCPAASCGQPIEIELGIEEILAASRERDAEEPLLVRWPEGGRQRGLALRRPNGGDQLTWLRRGFEDERSAKLGIIRTLAVESADAEAALEGAVGGVPDDPSDDWIGRIEERLGRHDPLVQFEVSVRCAYCDAAADHEVDVAALALARLRGAQARLVEAVHVLAWHYHWAEADILAMPPWRRERYLSLVEREGAR